MFTYKSALSALYFSIFLYFEYLGLRIEFLNTSFALLAIFSLYVLTRKELFAVGFIVSILWFWWIGYSFIYYDLIYFVPIVLIAIGFVYGVLFYSIGLFNNILYKIGFIFAISFIEPFGFNWFKFELPFIYSYLGTSKSEFFLILLSLGLFSYYRKIYKKRSILLLFSILLSLYFYNKFNIKTIQEPSLKIVKYSTQIEQNKKWNVRYKEEILEDNFDAIENAVNKNFDVIVFPETAFPLVLNKNEIMDERLRLLSYKISVVTGSLYLKDGLYYNSTYFYQNGDRQVAHKVVLVPFGEAVPMPEKIRNFINDFFYNGAKDYETAKKPTSFMIKNTKFRNAICYEITTDEIYENLDTPYVIAISNNAWFTPSIQPTLQKLLMQYYKNRYNLYYIDVTNR